MNKQKVVSINNLVFLKNLSSLFNFGFCFCFLVRKYMSAVFVDNMQIYRKDENSDEMVPVSIQKDVFVDESDTAKVQVYWQCLPTTGM